eukprot:s4424_g1.t1
MERLKEEWTCSTPEEVDCKNWVRFCGFELQWSQDDQRKLKAFVVLSTAEGELMSYLESMVMGDSLSSLVEVVEGQKVVQKIIYGDNTAAIAILENPDGPWRTRHLRLRANALRERLKDGSPGTPTEHRRPVEEPECEIREPVEGFHKEPYRLEDHRRPEDHRFEEVDQTRGEEFRKEAWDIACKCVSVVEYVAGLSEELPQLAQLKKTALETAVNRLLEVCARTYNTTVGAVLDRSGSTTLRQYVAGEKSPGEEAANYYEVDGGEWLWWDENGWGEKWVPGQKKKKKKRKYTKEEWDEWYRQHPEMEESESSTPRTSTTVPSGTEPKAAPVAQAVMDPMERPRIRPNTDLIRRPEDKNEWMRFMTEVDMRMVEYAVTAEAMDWVNSPPKPELWGDSDAVSDLWRVPQGEEYSRLLIRIHYKWRENSFHPDHPTLPKKLEELQKFRVSLMWNRTDQTTDRKVILDYDWTKTWVETKWVGYTIFFLKYEAERPMAAAPPTGVLRIKR